MKCMKRQKNMGRVREVRLAAKWKLKNANDMLPVLMI